MDAELRPLREQAHRRLRAAFGVIADRLDAAHLLRLSAEATADTIYAIASESTYLRMTEGAGLSSARYAEWLADTLSAILLKPAHRCARRAALGGDQADEGGPGALDP